MTTPRLFGSLFLVMALVLIALFVESGTQATRALTREIVAECREVSGDRAQCYEREVSALFPQVDVPRIFDIVREIRREDPTYQFCHVLGHKLGERVVAEDPERWVDAIPLNPADGMCSNGFIHGVVGGRFRAEVLGDATLESLVPDFTRACAPRPRWAPSDLDRAICYHGMGHLYDFITNADLPKALTLCSRTVPDEYQRVCIEGVFMQIYQPLEPDDFLMIEQMPVKPSTTTVRRFCARFADAKYEGACLRESWPYFQEEIMNGSGIETFCSGQPNTEEEDRCYQSMFSLVGRMSLGEPQKAKAVCSAMPAQRQPVCFLSVAQAVLEEDRSDGKGALALCRSASSAVADSCISELANRAQFIFGSRYAEYTQFCALLSGAQKEQCDISRRTQ